MSKGDAWSQTVGREPKAQEPSRPIAMRDSRPRMSPLMTAAAMAGMAVLALALVLFVLKPLLVQEDRVQAKQKPLPSFSLGSVVVNVAETDGRRYLKATVEVEPSGQKSLKEVESRRSQLIDLMIGVLSAKNLSEMTKPEGRDQIKQELLERFNAELGEEKKIARIYFAEFVVQ